MRSFQLLRIALAALRIKATTKRMQACDVLGTPEANTLLCDARKLDMLADEIVRLNAELTTALHRLEDMLMGDDGQAWKEAQRFVERARSI